MLPSIEFKLHPPENYQEQLKKVISELDSQREKFEESAATAIQDQYNKVIQGCANEIAKSVADKCKILDDPLLLNKAIEYAIRPQPAYVNSPNNTQGEEIERMRNIIENKKTTAARQDTQSKKQESCANCARFKELPNTNMSAIQKNVLMFFIKSDLKFSSLRGGKITFKPIKPETKQPTSFVELAADQYSKPLNISVKMPKPVSSEVLSKLVKEEKKRQDLEGEMVKNSIKSLNLQCKDTLQNLQKQLYDQFFPFYLASKSGQGSATAIPNSISHLVDSTYRFIQLDEKEIKKKFGKVDLPLDADELNEHLYKMFITKFIELPTKSTKRQMTIDPNCVKLKLNYPKSTLNCLVENTYSSFLTRSEVETNNVYICNFLRSFVRRKFPDRDEYGGGNVGATEKKRRLFETDDGKYD